MNIERMIQLKLIAWAAVVWFTFTMAVAARASEVDRLLDLLVNKGTLTAEEAAEFRSEVAIEKQQDLDKQAEVEQKKGKKYTVTSKRPIQVGGYAQVRGTMTHDANDSFLIRRGRLIVSGNISDASDYYLQVDVGNEARKAVSSVDFKKATTKTSDVQRPVLLDAQVNYALNPYSRITLGQFKIPFSQENLISDAELETINRAQVTELLVPGRDIGSQGRDLGVSYNGAVTRKSGGKLLEYAVGLFNGAGINVSDDNNKKDLVERVVWYPTRRLQLAASRSDDVQKASEDRHDRTGFDLAYYFPNNKTYLKSEYVFGLDGGIRKDGWYALLAHRFNAKWQGVLKFDTFDPDRDVANNESDVLTAGFNRFITQNIKLQVNYEHKKDRGAKLNNNSLLSQFQVQF